MDQNALSVIAGILLSALFSWVPKLNTWYNGLSDNYKRLIMFISLVVAVGVVFGAGCANLTIPGVTMTVACNQSGIKDLIQLLVFAVVANQTTFLLFPKPQ